MHKKKILLVSTIIGLLIGVFITLNSYNENGGSSVDENISIDDDMIEIDQSPNLIVDKQLGSDESNSKPNTPIARVSEKPEVSTAFGHSASNPVKSSQETSTSCTTEPKIECVLIFSNNTETITFDSKITDVEGIALWYWSGGLDIPSGKWNVFVKAGGKTSSTEVIYVQ